MIGLTEQQLRLLEYIEAYMACTGGVSPSYDEMREAIGLASKSGVHRLVFALEERGMIRRLPNRVRAIEILTPLAVDLTKVPLAALLAELERRGHSPLRPGSATTVLGRNSPEPLAEPPAQSGSGLSVHFVPHAATQYETKDR